MLAILTYHSIDESGSVISTSPAKFREQMKYLAQSGTKVLSLRELTNGLNEITSDSAVAITFDDGLKNFQDHAFPVLKDFGFPATIFLVTGFVGQNNQWPGQPHGIPSLELLDWESIRQLSSAGIEMGAHTVTHPDLTQLDPGRSRDEVVHSKQMIEQRIEKEVTFFAYPYGNRSAESRSVVEAEFQGACSVELDVVTPKSDRHFLPRIDMYYFSRNEYFFWINTPRFISYVRYRSMLRSGKKLFGRMFAV